MSKESSLKAALGEVSNFPIFANLKMSEIEALCAMGEITVTPHRQALFSFGHNANFFGIVLSGAYKLAKPTPNGTETIIYFSTPGDVVAAFIMPQPEPKYPVSAIAMGTSRFLKLPKSTYLNAWMKNPDIILRIQNLLSTRVAQLHNYKVLTKSTLSTKVASLILDILQKTNSQDDDLVLPLPLTRKEIADSLGASVEAVIRVMSDWSKSGIIETKDHQIKVLKLDKIIELINSAT